jgi:hypothetical protein
MTSWKSGLALAGAGLLAGLVTAAAQSQPPAIKPAEIGTVMSAYVDGVVEVRQFWTACANDPADWDKGVGILVASLKAAGLDAGSARDLQTRLAASGTGAAKYDCTGAVAAARLEVPSPKDWPSYHSGVLERVGIKVVVPVSPEDPRLAKVRAVVADYVPQQKAALNCTALVHLEWFPQTYADWKGLVDQAEAAIAAAGFDAEIVQSLVGPARAGELMEAIPVADRQDAITACIGDTKWMNWLGALSWYSFAGDIEKALGAAQ